MPLFNYQNGNPGFSELEMQNSIINHLVKYNYSHKHIRSVFSEIRIPEVGRISDVILLFERRTLFNIECKIFDVEGVILQARDHLMWADYSYICMPSHAYISNDHRYDMMKTGIGLLIWDIETKKPIEAIFGKFNRGKKEYKDNVLQKLTGIIEGESQTSIILPSASP